MAKLTEALKRQKADDSEALQKENEQMKKTALELTSKCAKFERDGQDLERIVNEQSALMKALNVRTFYFIMLFLRELFISTVLQ